MGPKPNLGVIAQWPQDKPMALVLFVPEDSKGLLEPVKQLIAKHPDISNWWLCQPENMIAGPSSEPGFAWIGMLEIKRPAVVRTIVEALAALPVIGDTIIHAAQPMPTHTIRLIRLVQAALKRLPAPSDPPVIEPDERWLGGANPTLEQMQRIEALPQDTPIGVLNIHRYRREAIDPYTGEITPGGELAGRYLWRGFMAFSRLGGHTMWAAAGKGQILGPATPRWQEFAMIWYPSRAVFQHLGRLLASGPAVAYRWAGLDIAHVWHTHIFASRHSRDVR